MSNISLWLLLLLVNYIGIIVAFKCFKKAGLFAWIALASILANIQVTKTIEMFGLVTTLGNIIYGSSFLATDILNECYSEKDAKRGVYIGIFSIIMTTIIMTICLSFTPHSSDLASKSLDVIFSFLPRITLASVLAYVISQNFDVWFYDFLKRKYPSSLWLRNNLSTMTSQLIDNVIFTLIAFWGLFEWEIIIQIFIATYIMKVLVALFDTPVIYLARYLHENDLDLNLEA